MSTPCHCMHRNTTTRWYIFFCGQSLVTLADPAPDTNCCPLMRDIRVDFPVPVVPTTGITSRKKAWSSSASFRSLSLGSKLRQPRIKEHSSSSLIPAPPRLRSIQFLSSSAENMNSVLMIQCFPLIRLTVLSNDSWPYKREALLLNMFSVGTIGELAM